MLKINSSKLFTCRLLKAAPRTALASSFLIANRCNNNSNTSHKRYFSQNIVYRQESPSSTIPKESGRYEKISSTVFVGNLEFTIEAEELENIFKDVEGLVGARVLYDGAGYTRGFGFIDFSDEASARKFIEAYNGFVIEGQQIRLDIANQVGRGNRVETNEVQTKKLFILNPSDQLSTEQLHEIFSKFGRVMNIRLSSLQKGGNGKNYALVYFKSVADAVNAKENVDASLIGDSAVIDYSKPADKKSREW